MFAVHTKLYLYLWQSRYFYGELGNNLHVLFAYFFNNTHFFLLIFLFSYCIIYIFDLKKLYIIHIFASSLSISGALKKFPISISILQTRFYLVKGLLFAVHLISPYCLHLSSDKPDSGRCLSTHIFMLTYRIVCI